MLDFLVKDVEITFDKLQFLHKGEVFGHCQTSSTYITFRSLSAKLKDS